MDARIDVRTVLGLTLGDAHIIRNAGGRVTEDVLRSLALSSATLGVDTVVVMQHTQCGLERTSDGALRKRTAPTSTSCPSTTTAPPSETTSSTSHGRPISRRS
jgi:carbonic anhydrase